MPEACGGKDVFIKILYTKHIFLLKGKKKIKIKKKPNTHTQKKTIKGSRSPDLNSHRTGTRHWKESLKLHPKR